MPHLVKLIVISFCFALVGPCFAETNKQCQHIDIAGSTIWFPYSYIDKDGVSRGIAHDLANEVLAEFDLEKVYHSQLPWRRIQKSLTFGTLDLLVSNHWTPERAEKWQLSAEIGLEKLYVYSSNADLIEVSQWQDLKGYKGTVTRGTALGENYHKFSEQLSVLEVLGHRQAFIMLTKGRTDYFLLTESAAQPYLKEYAFINIKRSKQPLEQYSIRMSFSKTSACAQLFDLFNQKLIEKIAQGRLIQLAAKYARLPPLKIDE